MAKSGLFLNGVSLLVQTEEKFGPKTLDRAWKETLARDSGKKLTHIVRRAVNRVHYGPANPNHGFTADMRG